MYLPLSRSVVHLASIALARRVDASRSRQKPYRSFPKPLYLFVHKTKDMPYTSSPRGHRVERPRREFSFSSPSSVFSATLAPLISASESYLSLQPVVDLAQFPVQCPRPPTKLPS